MRWLLIAVFLAASFLVVVANPTRTEAASCRFVLGFKTLHDLVPGIVGNCLSNEGYSDNGDALQRTDRGLLAWRSCDNFTAFTDGYRTWVNGPYGVQMRLNTERFPWEKGDCTRPRTGALLKDTWRNGRGQLTFENHYDSDAVAVLATPDRSPVVAFYIRSHESFAVTGIQDGTYHLYYTVGDDWDGALGRFAQPSRTRRFRESLDYVTRFLPDRITWVRFTIAIGKPGTASTDPVLQFPDLR